MRQFGGLSIKFKLTLLSVIFIACIAISAALTLAQLQALEKTFSEYNNVSVEGEKLTLMIARDTNFVSRLTRSIMLGDDYAKNVKKLDETIAAIYGNFKDLRSALALSSDLEKSKVLTSAAEDAERDARAFLEDGRQRVAALAAVERTPELLQTTWLEYHKNATPLANSARDSFAKLVKLADEGIKQSLSGTRDSIRNSTFITAAISIAVALSGFFAAMFISRGILRPLQQLRGAIDTIERESNLNHRIELRSRDEIGAIAAAFDAMLEKFHTIFKKIVSGTDNVTSHVRNMAETADATAREVAQQRSEVDQVATAITQMASTVQEVARNAADTVKATQSTDDEANRGRTVVTQSIDAINRLAEEVDRTAAAISQLERDSEAIGAVLDVIKGIAEQTNLLALNAAIEAARAGEQGRGFAVVADEVRTLASRTQASTQEIQSTIEKLQAGARNAVQVMESGRKQADTSVEQAANAGKALDGITKAVSTIASMNAQIAAAAEEQSAVAEEINKSIINISQIAKKTADAASSTNEGAEAMNVLVKELTAAVGQFKI